MAHFKCLPCRARVWRDGPAADHAGDLCPACGGPVEPVERAEELVGFRSCVEWRTSVPATPGRKRRLAKPPRARSERRGEDDDLVRDAGRSPLEPRDGVAEAARMGGWTHRRVPYAHVCAKRTDALCQPCLSIRTGQRRSPQDRGTAHASR